MANAAHEGEREAVYTINQIHSYDWLGVERRLRGDVAGNRASARAGTGCCPTLAHVGDDRDRCVAAHTGRDSSASSSLPLWLIVVGIWLAWHDSPAAPAPAAPGAVLP